MLHSAPVKKGDCFFIPSGTIHAIGAGILIAEIQQNSNSTYRVYDYGRVGTDGKPRELHIEKALDVTKRIPAAPPSGLPENVLADCAYFKVIRIPAGCSSSVQITDASFCAVLCTAGTGSFTCCGQTASCKAGDCCFIPAGSGELSFAGNAEFLLSFVK